MIEIYELYIVGELLAGPKHGYLLHSILKAVLGPFRQISWGVLYPLMNKLVKAGMLQEMKDETAAKGRRKRVFALTPEGRERFLELMETPLEYNLETEITFKLKMMYFLHVPVSIRISCIQQYLGYIQQILDFQKANEQHVAQHPNIATDEKEQNQIYFNYCFHVMEAEKEWLLQEMDRLISLK
ncbi:PadR family transcriptional regulator [Paenibacillus eucommiae]|uniref:DNA-binding PadR family transcriptional regulator n=1 Tax=Paenibacillus eucommiae TaxID=1355755 RepID=A0ABS4IU79_9BACL|nr:PadR family transcriptional regulator [Paenibacillus eucommiae]MBP1991113.1 DNA-binding PadR family transcriptional regulator [Paenibacillus eucommiae]